MTICYLLLFPDAHNSVGTVYSTSRSLYNSRPVVQLYFPTMVLCSLDTRSWPSELQSMPLLVLTWKIYFFNVWKNITLDKLEINIVKSQVMRVSRSNESLQIKVNNRELKEIDNFKYEMVIAQGKSRWELSLWNKHLIEKYHSWQAIKYWTQEGIG